MAKFKFSLIFILTILFLPNVISEVEIEANNQKDILFIDSGEKVFFNATGIENATSVEWDFSIDFSGPGTRYSNASNVEHTVHAAGRYNITFTARYENENISKDFVLIVNYIETFEEKIIYNEALFFAIAVTEIIMSFVLGYWTQQIRKDKIYL